LPVKSVDLAGFFCVIRLWGGGQPLFVFRQIVDNCGLLTSLEAPIWN
jgi:hypothetical protein